MRILGIDPGSQRCGYGVVERLSPRELRYIECGVVEPRRGLALPARLADILDGLTEIVAELRPDALAVEGVFHGVNARSALQLGHARGVALAVAGRAGLSVYEYAPSSVKRAVAGHGGATKEQVLAMVQRLCALRRPPRLDASDALAVALTHALRSRLRVGDVARGGRA
jgi:crossover junction endodeoxyribonuclease RuvC